MNFRYFVNLFLLIFAAALIGLPQTPSDTAKWGRYESDNGEFSVEMPESAVLFADKTGFVYTERLGRENQFSEMQILSGTVDKTSMWLEIYRTSSPRKAMRILSDNISAVETSLEKLPDGFTGRSLERTSIFDETDRKKIEISYVKRLYATKSYVYVLTVANRGPKTAAFSRFLDSVKLGSPSDGAKRLGTLNASGFNDILKKEEARALPPTQPQPQPKTKPTEKRTPLIVLEKPSASYPNEARPSRTGGQVIYFVFFDKAGRVSQIILRQGRPHGLSLSALYSAIRLKFLPSERDGSAISILKPVIYEFVVD